jgi:hypothetical protein
MSTQEKAVKPPKNAAIKEHNKQQTECGDEGYKRNVFCGAGPAGPSPTYVERDCENKPPLKNNYGSYICLTKDNMGPRKHGYGGKGDTNCAAIDLVVGRGACKNVGNDKAVDPLPMDDAARIYISEKSDIDEYFRLPNGGIGNAKTRSAVLIKADGIRVIGREGIKLVTGVATAEERNSQTGECARHGIELISMYEDGLDKNGVPLLQPLVKGDNLVAALNKIVADIDSLGELVGHFLSSQVEFNATVANHIHISPYFAAPSIATPMTTVAGILQMKHQVGKSIPDLVKNKLMFKSVKTNYLSPSGTKYILSPMNKTN